MEVIVDNIIQITVLEFWAIVLGAFIEGAAFGWYILARMDDVRSTHLTQRATRGRVLLAVVGLALLIYVVGAITVSTFAK
jgi:hypothetical protein